MRFKELTESILMQLNEDVNSFDQVEIAIRKSQPQKLKKYFSTIGNNKQQIENIFKKIPNLDLEFIRILVKGGILEKSSLSQSIKESVFSSILNKFEGDDLWKIVELFYNNGFEVKSENTFFENILKFPEIAMHVLNKGIDLSQRIKNKIITRARKLISTDAQYEEIITKLGGTVEKTKDQEKEEEDFE